MGKLQTATTGFPISSNSTDGIIWRYYSDNTENRRFMRISCTLALDILRSQALVVALSTLNGTEGVSRIALHANLTTKHSCFCFRESCHVRPTNFPYLTTTKPSLSSVLHHHYIETLLQRGQSMRIVRLPGIHHDSNVILVIGTLGNIMIDSGTSWYQSLQLERVMGILDDDQEKKGITLTGYC